MSNQNLVGKDRSESESSNNDRFSPGFRMRAVSEIYSLDTSGFASFSPDSRGAPEIASEYQVFTPTCGEEVMSPVDTTLMHTKSEVIRSSPASSEVTRSVRSSTRARNRLFSELSISDMPADFGEGKLSRYFLLNGRSNAFSRHHPSLLVRGRYGSSRTCCCSTYTSCSQASSSSSWV